MSSKPSIAWPRKEGWQIPRPRKLLGALADPDLVHVAIEPGTVADAARGSFSRGGLIPAKCDASRVLGRHFTAMRSQTPVGVSKIDMPGLSVIVSTPGARRWAARFAGVALEGKDPLSHSGRSDKLESLQIARDALRIPTRTQTS